jgi:hypothetical protein
LLLRVKLGLNLLLELIEELRDRGFLVSRHIPELLKKLLNGPLLAQQVTTEQLDILGALDLAELTLEAFSKLSDVCL